MNKKQAVFIGLANSVRAMHIAAYAAFSLILATILAAPAYAVTDVDDIPWDSAFSLVGTNGIIDPEVLVGFNPQPDPPGTDPGRIADLLLLNSMTTAEFKLTGQSNPQLFQFFFAVDLPGVELVVQEPERPLGDFDSLLIAIDALVPGAPSMRLFDVELGFRTSSSGVVDIASLVGFNPQPDPPGAFGAEFGMLFGYTSLSDAFVTFSIRDVESNELLQLRQVPEPTILALLSLGFAGLAFTRRRKV